MRLRRASLAQLVEQSLGGGNLVVHGGGMAAGDTVVVPSETTVLVP